MNKTSQTLFSVVFAVCLSSLSFGDATGALTRLVGTNAESYFGPMGTMLGTDMNSGYFRKASPHKIFGFDLTFDMAYAIAPAGNTTYDFVLPADTVDFDFPFKFPKTLLLQSGGGNIADENIGDIDGDTDDLFKDQIITFDLTVDDLLDPPDKPAQNIFGCTYGDECQETIEVTYDAAADRIFDQIVTLSWDKVKEMDGLGKEYTLETPAGDIQIAPKYSSKEEFSADFADSIRVNINNGLNTLPDLTLPVPPGSAGFFPVSPIGLPLPILQGSLGLPFHTEITFRGLPAPVEIKDFGTITYSGFGGKIGISEFLNDILYSKANLSTLSDTNIINIIQAHPSDIDPMDVENVMSGLRLQNIDVQEIDSLNFLLAQGNPAAAEEIQIRMIDAQLQLESMPKSKKKKKFPFDLSLGYYTNDFVMNMVSTDALYDVEGINDGEASINSTNKMLSLQISKTFNLPSYLSFIGGVGIYGGLGFEWSNLDIKYTLMNPMAYGCFTTSGNTETYDEDTVENNCTDAGEEWKSGVPTPISLSFPGDNKFRSLIGARMRILFVDVYADYNMGASNALNAGLGITIR